MASVHRHKHVRVTGINPLDIHRPSTDRQLQIIDPEVPFESSMRRAYRFCTFPGHGFDYFWQGARYECCARLEDRQLFRSDRFEGSAQIFGVLDRNTRDDGDLAGNDVGRIEATTQSNFYDSDIDRGLRKIGECTSGSQLEIRCSLARFGFEKINKGCNVLDRLGKRLW